MHVCSTHRIKDIKAFKAEENMNVSYLEKLSLLFGLFISLL